MAWYAWVIDIGAVLALIGLGIAFAYAKDKRRFASWSGAVACVVLATAALTLAVLIPAKAPDWLRASFGLESGAKTAATPWAQWALVAIAVAFIILPRLWGRAIWPDVAVALVLTIGIYATIKQHQRADRPKKTAPVPSLTFTFPTSAVKLLGTVPEKTEAYAFVVRPKTLGDGTVVTYESHRYNAKRVTCTPNNVCIAIERGEDDKNIISFTAAVEDPTRVYLSPRK